MRRGKFSVSLLSVCLTLGFLVLVLGGCGQEIREVSPGYIGKILTPTGWKAGFLEAGQVDLGAVKDGKYNTLVLCEATSITIKEQFLGPDSSPDKEDHRILTMKMIPVAVDFYIRASLPDSEADRNKIFAMVTPTVTKDSRVRAIRLEDIYTAFAKQDVRGKARATLSEYADHKTIQAAYQEVSSKISAMVIDTFKANGVPLKVHAAQLSNVKPDKQIWEADNRLAAAEAEVSRIKQLGETLKENPAYVEYRKWKVIETLGQAAAEKGNPVIVVGDVSPVSMSAATYGATR